MATLHLVGYGCRSGVYTVAGEQKLSGMRKWYAVVTGWLDGHEQPLTEAVYRAYNKHGSIIWESTWMRYTTKAWLYLVTALLVLLVVTWLSHRKKRAS